MILQRLARQVIQGNNKKQVIQQLFCSSSSQGEQKIHDFKDTHQVTQDQISKDQQAQDDVANFQRQWQEISDAKDEEQLRYLNEELSENQRKKVDLIAQALVDLNSFETRYLTSAIRMKILKSTNIDMMKLNTDWPAVKQLENGTWPPNNPNWFTQQEAIAKLWPAGQQGMSQLFGNVFGGAVAGGAPAGGAQAAAGASDEAPAAEEKKEEKVKQNFNVELAKFDAASKIKIIKEVRTVLGLGLKDAKDTVEKAPTILKTNIGKSEAEELKEKLEKIGCTINLL